MVREMMSYFYMLHQTVESHLISIQKLEENLNQISVCLIERKNKNIPSRILINAIVIQNRKSHGNRKEIDDDPGKKEDKENTKE